MKAEVVVMDSYPEPRQNNKKLNKDGNRAITAS